MTNNVGFEHLFRLKTGRSFWMIRPPSVNISLIFRPSLTWTTANIEVCEPPGQNTMRSVGTDKWSFFGWVFVYELNCCGFESHCSRSNFRFRVCFEQGVPWHSGNYKVWIHSETRSRQDKNIQSVCVLFSNIEVWIPSFTTTGALKPISLTSRSRFLYVSSRFSHGFICLIDEFSLRSFAGAKEHLYIIKSAFFWLRYSLDNCLDNLPNLVCHLTLFPLTQLTSRKVSTSGNAGPGHENVISLRIMTWSFSRSSSQGDSLSFWISRRHFWCKYLIFLSDSCEASKSVGSN